MGGSLVQMCGFGGLEGVWELGCKTTPAGTDVLHGLQKQLSTGNTQFAAQPLDHLISVQLALLDGLQLNEHARRVDSAAARTASSAAGGSANRLHRRIVLHDPSEL